ncbi:MAG TPA: aldo/keto reductase [Terriglobales bacterium]|jgi:aryl-alcohol dehydrogenase-like predicted oxidoreductase|nr:aldo/keto reductase [Terriglobales bacterium]
MKLRTLGRTGFQVSDVAYGLWGMSGWSGSDDQQSRQSMQLAVDLDCNFFDSAWAYGDGKSDLFLGETLRQNSGKRLYAASKIPPKNRKWPASPNDSYKDVFPTEHVFHYADLIRKNLQVDSMDLLQFHVWDDGWTEEKEFHETVSKLKRDGVVRSFGLSLNRWEPWNGIRALRTGLVDVVQVIYNIFDQAPEDELFPICRELNIGVIARVPLDEGSLSGTFTTGTKFPENDWRSRYFNPENLRLTLERIEKLKALLPGSMSLPEMAIRYILSNPVVSTTIVGMRSSQHVRQNLALSDAGALPPELLAKLKAHRWDRKPNPSSD